MANILQDILNFVFPITCIICGKYLPADDKRRICDSCWSEVKFIDLRCQKCGKPLPYGGAHCYRCLKSNLKYSFEFIRSVCLYKGVIKESIHLFKYSGKEYLGNLFSDLLTKHIRSQPDFPIRQIDKIIPVPLHWRRKFQRGYNQAEILARRLAGVFNKELVLNVVYRKKSTKPQFNLSKEKRFENIRGAFKIKESTLIRNKTILIIDDVCTTGSTLEECSNILKKAGAAKIFGLTVARG
jgi:ComF family protein